MPKNVENFEIRTLGRDDYAQAAEIFALCMRCTKQIARIFTERRMSRSAKTNFSKCAMTRTKSCCVRCETAKF